MEPELEEMTDSRLGEGKEENRPETSCHIPKRRSNQKLLHSGQKKSGLNLKSEMGHCEHQ